MGCDTMHELSVTQGILKIVEAEAKKNDVNKVLSVTLKVGQLSGVMPQLIQDYFDLVAMGTVVEGAKLIIERVPATIKCLDCNEISSIDRIKLRCPKCNSIEVKIITGKEFHIECMEVDKDGD
jgi:hydrogenase nickel incorporation protein HypA/HybF